MKLNQIKTDLESQDVTKRMKAITQLQNYDSEIAVSLLKTRFKDREVIVRSFVAMTLGRKRNEKAFKALVEMIELDTDANVRAAAANSLAQYKDLAIPSLVKLLEKDSYYLVEQSLFSAFLESQINCLFIGYDN